MLRTEYISPQWSGQLLLVNSFSSPTSLSISDSFTQQVVEHEVTDGQVTKFKFDAKTKSVSWKLPAASMARHFTLNFQSANFKFGLTQLERATSAELITIDVGTIIIDPSALELHDNINQALFTKMMELTDDQDNACKSQLRSTIYLAAVTLKLAKKKYPQVVNTESITQDHHHWSVNALEFSDSLCFSKDYKKRQSFARLKQEFISNLNQHLN